jgi:hypothetical protein
VTELVCWSIQWLLWLVTAASLLGVQLKSRSSPGQQFTSRSVHYNTLAFVKPEAVEPEEGLPEGTSDTVGDSTDNILSATPGGYESIVIIALSFTNFAISEFTCRCVL